MTRNEYLNKNNKTSNSNDNSAMVLDEESNGNRTGSFMNSGFSRESLEAKYKAAFGDTENPPKVLMPHRSRDEEEVEVTVEEECKKPPKPKMPYKRYTDSEVYLLLFSYYRLGYSISKAGAKAGFNKSSTGRYIRKHREDVTSIAWRDQHLEEREQRANAMKEDALSSYFQTMNINQ